MEPGNATILVINAGSSSIKFAMYQREPMLVELFSGEIENIGSSEANLKAVKNKQQEVYDINATDYSHAASSLIDWLQKQEGLASVKAIGHRVVHGMKHLAPECVTKELLEELKKISVLDPDHLPNEIMLIEYFGKRYSTIAQFACFDTFFHSSMPQVAKLLSLPRKFYEKGIRRYGFHGLSYAYLIETLEQEAGSDAAKGKVIIAHMGSGASLAAIKEGKSIDTSMGFTPSSGILMSTRSGDIDPGVVGYLMLTEKLSTKEFSNLINHKSGLLGLSETSGDMKTLLTYKSKDYRASEAIDLFCYQAKKWIGSYIAILEGLDTLLFSGGIGEHSADVRAMICHGLEFMGIELDEVKNATNQSIISTAASKVCVRVIKTNEQIMIAKLVNNILNHSAKNNELCKQ